MARLHHWSFRDIAVPFLKQLHEKTGETVFLGVLRDTEVLIIDSLSHPQGIAFRTQIGVAEPLYCTGIGKALLAHLPQPAREDILKKIHLKRWTEYTIRSKTALRRELFIVQRQGYAVDRGEHSPGVQCIGVPIFDHQSLVVGSFSIAGPDVRMNERIKDFADLAMSVGRKISRGLGYSDFRTMAVASSK
jgi:DNA-binding IclR family transcriptional regulator